MSMHRGLTTWPTAAVRVRHYCIIFIISFQLNSSSSAAPALRVATHSNCVAHAALCQRKKNRNRNNLNVTQNLANQTSKLNFIKTKMLETSFVRQPMSTGVKLKRLQRSKNGFKVFDSYRKYGVASAKTAAINHFRFDRAA